MNPYLLAGVSQTKIGDGWTLEGLGLGLFILFVAVVILRLLTSRPARANTATRLRSTRDRVIVKGRREDG